MSDKITDYAAWVAATEEERAVWLAQTLELRIPCREQRQSRVSPIEYVSYAYILIWLASLDGIHALKKSMMDKGYSWHVVSDKDRDGFKYLAEFWISPNYCSGRHSVGNNITESEALSHAAAKALLTEVF